MEWVVVFLLLAVAVSLTAPKGKRKPRRNGLSRSRTVGARKPPTSSDVPKLR